ncbi:MAG: ABC transporter substrate-binding protein [Acidimicrobiales bacterium]|jgi:peptide/nickel transport system substrate-binding protein
MSVTRGLKRALRAGAVGAATAIVLAACSSSPPLTTRPKVPAGETISWAEQPAQAPDWIFPFASLTYFGVANLATFQYLMYRPLYWFGQVATPAPTLDESLSLAGAPAFSNGDKTVTVTTKGWQYSNGQKVDAQAIVFWMNMMKADGTVNGQWAGYVPGGFPDNIKSYSAPDGLTGDTVVFQLTKAYSPRWYLYNDLSQIVPMPEAWDVTSLTGKPGSGGCGSSTDFTALAARCTAVWKFDTDGNGTAAKPQMAGDTATYASNKLWQVVDGPWHLAAFDAADGRAVFEPNKAYSGPQKPRIARFIELPFSTAASEYAALEAGGSAGPEVGSIPPGNVPVNTGPLGSSGPNAAAMGKYDLVPAYGWSIDYMAENYDSTGDGGNAGAIFKQLYVREALQMGVNQPEIIKAYFKGYGVPTYGPVPAFPQSSFASHQMSTNAFPFNVAKGLSLLERHGWKLAGGVATCESPGSGASDCGTGIKSGATMSFQLAYASGVPTLAAEVGYEVSEWAKEGIAVKTSTEPFAKLIGLATPCPKGCQWQIADWGQGWNFSPDYMPSGEEIFATGGGSNYGDYSNAYDDSLITETNASSSPATFTKWENYLAGQLPVIWQPNGADELYEVAKDIGGVAPVNALANLTPEYWYVKKS